MGGLAAYLAATTTARINLSTMLAAMPRRHIAATIFNVHTLLNYKSPSTLNERQQMKPKWTHPMLPFKLNELRLQGLKIAVITENEELAEMVSQRITMADTIVPISLHVSAFQKLQVDPRECIVFGDTCNDMRAARDAKAYAVGVLTGADNEDALYNSGAPNVTQCAYSWLCML